MSRERKPYESTEQAQQAAKILDGLDGLHEDEEILHARYQAATEDMKALANESLLAAAFVDVETNSVLSRMIAKIAATKDIVRQVASLEAKFESGEDEMALTFERNHVALFNTALADDIRISYRSSGYDTSLPSASLVFHPWLVSYISRYGGALDNNLNTSYFDDDSHSGGGSMTFVAGLHTLHEGVRPFGNDTMPTLTLGRQAIIDLYADTARKESAHFSTHHRSRMGSFAIWRLRAQDDMISADVDAITSEYGLADIWTGQYRDEIAAKVAHLLKCRAADQDEPNERAEFEFKYHGFEFLDDERELFTPTEPDLRKAIAAQCERLAVSATDMDVAKAIEHVWGDEPLA